MNELRIRYKLVMEAKRTNANQLSCGNQSTQVKLSRQLNGDTAISYDTIMLLLNAYPDVSADWLLRGTGSMIAGDRKSIAIDTMTGGQVQVGGQGNHQTLTHASDAALLKEKDARIAELEKDKEFLTTLVKNITGK